MYGRLFLYTPRSGSKIIAQSQSSTAPRWAVETLNNGSHIIHYTAPLYRVPASTRQHRADVGSILRHIARSADRSTNPRSLLAWDQCGQISFVADAKAIMDIEAIVRKFGRGEGILEAIQHAREEAEIFGDGGADTRLFAHPVSGAILYVANSYVSTHPPHKSRAAVEAEPPTFGDLPTEHALSETKALLQVLWDGMSAPVPTPEEAEQIVSRFAAWMDWCDDESHREDIKAMLLCRFGQELQDWANEFFSKYHRLSLCWHPDDPAHWASGDEEPTEEPTPEPIAEIASEPTPEDVAAQKKNEEDAAFAEIWREHIRGSIGHWMAANLDHPYPVLDSDADVIAAHSAICERVAGVWSGWSDLWWRTPDIFCRATDPSSLESYPASLPALPVNEEFGDSPNDDVWTEWLAQLNPAQLLAFLIWMGNFYGQTSEMWENIDISNISQKQWDVMSAISHTFPFPYSRAVSGLDGHPTRHELTVLPPRKTQDLNNNRRRMPPHKWNVIRRHFAALVKMAEHAPE